jgi:chromosome segregation ATPase
MLKKPGMPGGADYMVARGAGPALQLQEMRLHQEIEALEKRLESLKAELQQMKESLALQISFGDSAALREARSSVGSKEVEKADCQAELKIARVELLQLLEAQISEHRRQLEEWEAEYIRLCGLLETAGNTEPVFEQLAKLNRDQKLLEPELARLIELKATLDATISCN